MDDTLKRQINQLLEKANGEKAIDFLIRVADIELPAQEDRVWLLEQFNTIIKDFEEEGDKKIRNVLIILTLFTMGRVWERYYVPDDKK